MAYNYIGEIQEQEQVLVEILQKGCLQPVLL